MKIQYLWACASMLALTSATAGQVIAQDTVEPAPGGILVLDTIVITGEHLSRSIFDTASSVKAFSSREIEEKVSSATVADVVREVPNVLYPDTVSAPVIRGQDTQGPNWGAGAFMGGTVPRARVNLDGHYLTYNELVFGASGIWDVESIEVFRGPQTSFQGANSIAGAISVKTKDPTFTPEGAVQMEYGTDRKRRASFMYSAPISDDLAARIALDYSARDTFIDYINPSFTKGDTDQDFRLANARLKLLWQPQALPGFEAKLTYSHNRTNRPTSEAASPPYGQNQSATLTMPSWEQMVNTVIADMSYDFGNDVVVTNQLQYSHIHTDRLMAPMENGAAWLRQKDISNETRITFGTEDSPFSGVAGLYYDKFTSDERLLTRGESVFDDTKQSLGLYGEAVWRPDPAWALTAGLRYQRDRIERRGTSSFTTGALDYDRTFDEWLPRLSVAYDVSDDLTVGALVSKGYNPGGVSLSFSTGEWLTFDPETAWNYELFGRAGLMDGRLLLTGNLFYTRFKDSQRVLPDYLNGIPYGNVVVNADRATSYGLEVQADFEATDTLRLHGGLGLLRTKIDRLQNVSGVSYEDNDFGRSPGAMVNLGAEWDVLPNATISGSVRYVDDYYSTDENDPAYRIGEYTIGNIRFTYRPREDMELFAYVNNVFDENKPTYMFDDRSAGGIIASMLEPRQAGIGMNWRF